MKKLSLSDSTKSTIAYTIASLFSKGLAFLTIPIFTRIMSTEQIGVVNLYNSWFSLIYVFSTLSLTSGGYQVALRKYAGQRDRYVSSVLTVTSIISVLISILIFILRNPIKDIMGLDQSLVGLMCFGFFVSPAMDFWLARQKYEYKYKLATFVTLTSAVLATGLSILFVIKVDNSASIRLWTNFIVIYGIDFLVLICLFAKGKTFFSKEYWSFSLKLGIPMVAYSVAAQILNASDRLMINYFVGESAVGIYGTLYSIGAITQILWNALNASFVPYLHSNIESNHVNTRKVSELLLAAYTLFSVLLTLFAPEIIYIFATDEYFDAILIMPPICAGVFLMAVSNLYSNVLLYYQKPRVIMLSSVTAAIANVVLNYIFIPVYGYYAASFTTMVSYIILAMIQGMYVTLSKFGRNYQLTKVYNNLHIIIISVTGGLLCLASLVLYNFIVLRYVIIVLLIALSLLIIKKYRFINSLFG